MTPDGFGGAAIPIEILANAIPNRTFRSDAELRDVLRAAQPVTLRGEVVGGVEAVGGVEP